MIAPGVLLCILPHKTFCQRGSLTWRLSPREFLWRQFGGLACGLVLLAFTWLYTLRDWQLTGGHGHETYRTAAIEPKLQAWQKIMAESQGKLPPRIIVTSWWLEWPLAYLANGRAEVLCVTDPTVNPKLLVPEPQQDLWIVEIFSTLAPRYYMSQSWLENEQPARVRHAEILDPGGHSILRLQHLPVAKNALEKK
jgi:hypothetical protein